MKPLPLRAGPAASALMATLFAAACTSPPTTGPMHSSTGAPSVKLSPARPSALSTCAELSTTFRHAATLISSAEHVAAGPVRPSTMAQPEHCLVKGRMHAREADQGRSFAIGFEMRLPLAWNGRFYYQGNGGLDGAVVPALGALGGGPVTGALKQGFAVISSDAGHTLAQTPFFGTDAQARRNYGYQAVLDLTPMAKAMIAAAYGRGPDRSYIGGCSNGGRHAMVAAARIGEHYDGYLVGAPGYRLPIASLANLWGAGLWQSITAPGATMPNPTNAQQSITDLGSAFTAPERAAVAQAVLQRCDALDGARDGIVHDTAACQAAFDIQRDVPTCTGARNGNCLTPEQKRVLAQVQAGHTLRNGQALYTSFFYDPGIVGANWAQWRFIESIVRGPIGSGSIFSTPPMPLRDPFHLEVDARRAAMDATNEQHRESVLSLMNPPGEGNPVNLSPLWARGARMMIYHGVSDSIFSAEDTRRWWERVDRIERGRGNDAARLFMVPGMNHCSGGPAADHFDMLTPLVRWVEEGIAPASVQATARGPGHPGGANAEVPADWGAARTRPLCAWPAVARYDGRGALDRAESFQCR